MLPILPLRPVHGAARLVQDLAGLQRGEFQVGRDPRIFLVWETGQDPIPGKSLGFRTASGMFSSAG
jgi:hypothetical protein